MELEAKYIDVKPPIFDTTFRDPVQNMGENLKSLLS